MGVPAGIQAPVQAVQNEPRPTGQGQPPAAEVRSGVNLDLNAAVINRIGGGSGHGDAVPQGQYTQPTADKIRPVPKIAAQVPGPRLGHQEGNVSGADRGEDNPLRQGGSAVCQPTPVKDVRLLADGVAEEGDGPRPPDGPDHRDPIHCPWDQDGAVRLSGQSPGGKTRQKTEISYGA